MVSDRSRRLNKRVGELFPQRKLAAMSCDGCSWERTYRDPSALRRVFRYAREGCPECGDDLAEPDIREVDDGCRVCGEPAAPSRTRYCSERCSDIASAVQRMFTWSSVRERVLNRDSRLCQNSRCERGAGNADVHVDHIHELQDDGHPLDERNLITLCDECHAAKTHGSRVFTSEDAPGLKLETPGADVSLADFMDD